MKILELKRILKDLPDEAEIILSVSGHYNFCDTGTHGNAQVALVKIQGKPVFVFSADNCGFDAGKLNYQNLNSVTYIKRV